MIDNLIDQSIATFYALATVNNFRKKCECEKPMAGVFDDFDWSTCQKCQRLIGFADLVNREMK